MAALEPQLPPMFLLLLILPLGILAQHSQPEISGPLARVGPGATVNFSCEAHEFPVPEFTITWTKDGKVLQPIFPIIVIKASETSFGIKSNVRVPLTEQDINSTLTCQIDYKPTEKPLQKSYNLRDVLRVAPHVTVETTDCSPIPLNRSVTLTCVVNNFYPNVISVAWWRNDDMIKRANNNGNPNPDGTFSLRFPISTQPTRETTSNYNCEVIHDSQSPVHVYRVLNFRMQTKGNGNVCFIESGLFLLSNLGLWIGLLVGKVVTGVLFLCLFLRKSASKIE